MTEKKDPPYFMYFPGNYRWSAAFINMLSSGPYGGSEIGELHKIGSRLKGKAPDDDEAWFDACAAVADGVRAYADQFAQKKHRFAAAHAYQRAANYYHMAERFRTPKDEKALSIYLRSDKNCTTHSVVKDFSHLNIILKNKFVKCFSDATVCSTMVCKKII